MTQKIIITGASSQIGDFLLPLLQQKFQVFSLSRTAKNDKNCQWIQANISQPEAILGQLPEADTLIHIAPLPLLPPLLDTFKQKGIKRIIAIGSTSMFGKQGSHTLKEQTMVVAFQQAEQKITAFCQHQGINWTIFRPTLVYGCGKDKNVTFIATFMKRYHCFPVVGQAKGLRQPVHSEDLAQACLQVLELPSCYNKVYNLSGGETLTYRAMLQRIVQVQQQRVLLLPVPLLLFRVLVVVARILPSYRYLTPDMADRINQNLCFSHQEASKDFGYEPRPFQPPKV